MGNPGHYTLNPNSWGAQELGTAVTTPPALGAESPATALGGGIRHGLGFRVRGFRVFSV